MIHFAWLPILVLIFLPILVRRFMVPADTTSAALMVPFYQHISPDQDSKDRKNLLRWIFFSLIWILLILASARPQFVGDAVNVPVTGRDLMLAVDVSGSMKADDMISKDGNETRLNAVKRVAGEFIQRREGDRLGLILFGTYAYLQTPLSLDRESVNTLLQEAAIGIAGEKTAIGDAIGLAIKRFEDRESRDKVLILLTDGSNTAGSVEPEQASMLAASTGLKIHTVGIGATQRQVRGFFGTQLINPSSDLDEKLLRRISSNTGGQFFRAEDTQGLEEIYQLIDKLEPVERDTQHLRPTRELFHWPLGLALCMVLFFLLYTLLFRIDFSGQLSKVANTRNQHV